MPTYDYECTSCKHAFEAFQSMTDEPLDSCPKCGKRVRRLIGGGMGIIFKGSGFYSTDNRSGGNGSKHDVKPAAAEKETSTAASADSKAKPAKPEKKKATA